MGLDGYLKISNKEISKKHLRTQELTQSELEGEKIQKQINGSGQANLQILDIKRWGRKTSGSME